MNAWVLTQFLNLPKLVGFDHKYMEDKLSKDLVKIDIKASAINHRDVWITQGKYPNIQENVIMGSDASGVCNGQDVILNPGQLWGSKESAQSNEFNIIGMPDHGTFADYIYVDKKQVYPKPEYLTYVQAAALPLAGVTAFRAFNIKAQPVQGEKVLISGIGGGVAQFVMQYALALGCEVYVTSSSPQKIEQAVSLGAKKGYIYHNPDWTKAFIADAGGVDIIIDSACGEGFNSLIKVCNPGARVVFYGATKGKIDGLNPQAIFWKQISIMGSTMGSDRDFGQMLEFVSHHKIVPVIDEVFTFDQISLGFQKLTNGSQFGKIVFRH